MWFFIFMSCDIHACVNDTHSTCRQTCIMFFCASLLIKFVVRHCRYWHGCCACSVSVEMVFLTEREDCWTFVLHVMRNGASVSVGMIIGWQVIISVYWWALFVLSIVPYDLMMFIMLVHRPKDAFTIWCGILLNLCHIWPVDVEGHLCVYVCVHLLKTLVGLSVAFMLHHWIMNRTHSSRMQYACDTQVEHLL